ncbi:hypothetical protein [Burkholderia sp. LMU1-1-1.1]|uniref:hypothetical protein n=1 Tax=Burkholderia sp. LMU1-1-1.1 TaxID=3135266 RepID=UPI00342418F2
MAKGKTRGNPFLHHSVPGEHDQARALVPWIWRLEGLIPEGKDFSFESVSHRPGVYRPLICAIWQRNVDCIPPKSHSNLYHQRQYLERFDQFLSTHKYQSTRDISTLYELQRETLIEYRSWLYAQYKPDTARKSYRGLVASLLLLRGEASPLPGTVRSDLEIPTRALLPGAYGNTAISPYTSDEQASLVAACKVAINGTIERLNEGKRLLSKGEDPQQNGATRNDSGRLLKYSTAWDSIPNILWYIVHVLKGRMPCAQPVEDTRAPLVKFLLNKRAPIRKKDAFDLLYLHSFDIVPFIALVSLKTGLNAESILTLERDCLQGSEGHMTWVKYKKSRGTHEILIRKFSHRGANSPVGLIKLVLQLTQELVVLAAPDIQKYLWLSHQLKKGQKDKSRNDLTNKGDVIDISHFNTLINGGIEHGKRRQGFLEKHNVRGRDGEILRFSFMAARKTEATSAYLKHGNLANVSKKVLKHHGKEALTTTAMCYLTNDATHHVHDAAVRNAQDKAVFDARISVITGDQPDKLEIQRLSKELKVPAKKVIAIVNGEQDVFIASCKDFYNKPGGKPDTACDDPWTCFGCSNGLWTSRILPRVVKFLWFMEEQRNLLTHTDWAAKFSVPYRAITQEILPRFQARTIEWAKAEAEVSPFYVPTRLREL